MQLSGGFGLRGIGNDNLIFHRPRAAGFGEASGHALVLHDVSLSVDGGDAVFYRNGKVLGVDFGFSELLLNSVLDLSIGKRRFHNRRRLIPPRARDGENQCANNLLHACSDDTVLGQRWLYPQNFRGSMPSRRGQLRVASRAVSKLRAACCRRVGR